MKNKILAIIMACSVTTITACSPTSAYEEPNRSIQKNNHLKGNTDKRWWSEDKFGLFIHWGLYSEYAGEFEGKMAQGLPAWMQYSMEIPLEKYKQGLKTFNPTDFDALKIVQMAKDAGMKYIVFTAKHHDGFAMYDSKVSDYNIVAQTPYGKDPLAALDKACKELDMKLGVYYSHVIDWESPYAEHYIKSNGVSHNNYWDFPASSNDYDKFYKNKSLPQIKELLTNYDVSLIWLDMAGQLPENYVKGYADTIRKISPKTIINSRIAPDLKKGESPNSKYYDYLTTADNFDEGAKNDGSANSFPFEVAATMNTSWADKKGEYDWKPFPSLLQSLVDIVSKGGNYLLNIGPDASGKIPEGNVERLSAFNLWMQSNSEAIHGTNNSPFNQAFDWGRFTAKDNNLYAIILNWPEQHRLDISGLISQVSSVSILGSNQLLEFTQTNNNSSHNLSIQLPENVDKHNTVIKITMAESIATQSLAVESIDGKILLSRQFMNEKGQYWKLKAHGGQYKVTIITGENHGINTKGQQKWLAKGLTGELQINGKGQLPINLRRDKTSYDPQKHFWSKVHTNIGQISLTPGQHSLALNSLLLNDSKHAEKGALLLEVRLEKIE